MTDIDDHSGMSEDELLAAEYVLGVLAGADRAAAERLFQRDANFAAMVAAWEQRLTPWAREIADVSPPPQVWEAIAAALPAGRRCLARAFGKASPSGAALRSPARSLPRASRW